MACGNRNPLVYERMFDLVLAPGTYVAFAQELEKRPDAEHIFEALATIWANRVPKSQVQGIHETLFYGLIGKRKYYPTLRDEEADPDGSRLRAGGFTTFPKQAPA